MVDVQLDFHCIMLLKCKASHYKENFLFVCLNKKNILYISLLIAVKEGGGGYFQAIIYEPAQRL